MYLTDYHAKYFAHELTKRCASDSLEKLTGALVDAQEEATDLTNDHEYLDALQTTLKQYHDELMCQGSSPTQVR
jgi:hypothetical protein